MAKLLNLKKEIEQLSIHESAFLKPSSVIFMEEVRDICKQNKCGMYNSSWACPPASGRVEECKAKCLSYQQALMFTTISKMKNSYDFNGWVQAGKLHEKVTDQVVDIIRDFDHNALVLSTEGCMVCKKCTYPTAPCRFPERMYPAIEGYGIMVIEQAEKCKIKYNNGKDVITYFSMIFYNAKQ